MGANDDPPDIDDPGKADYDPAIYAEDERRLAEDPSALLHIALNRLVTLFQHFNLFDYSRHSPNVEYPVQLEVAGNHTAHLSTKRLSWRRSKGYRIKVNNGFFYLLNDVAELTVGYSEVISRTGDLITPTNFTEEEVRAILHESVTEYVMGENRWSPSQKLARNNRERLLRELRLASARRRESIHTGRRLLLIIFTLAHELGHVVLKHCDPLWFSFSTPDERAQELEADRIAAAFLVDMISIPPLWWLPVETDELLTEEATEDPFTNLLMVGFQLKQKRLEQRLRYYTWDGEDDVLPASVHDIILSNALTSVAALFVVLELTETASKEYGKALDRRYPPARDRYEAFRRACIENFGVSEHGFSEHLGSGSPPDRIYELFRKLAEGIEWRNSNRELRLGTT